MAQANWNSLSFNETNMIRFEGTADRVEDIRGLFEEAHRQGHASVVVLTNKEISNPPSYVSVMNPADTPPRGVGSTYAIIDTEASPMASPLFLEVIAPLFTVSSTVGVFIFPK